jgi:dDENN domain
MVQSQAFSQFILERLERPETDYEILFFDESIKAMLNRSKPSSKKELTPFLKEPSYQVTKCVQSVPPNLESLKEPNCRKLQDHLLWDDELVLEPRIIEPLFSQTKLTMMKSETLGLVKKARAAEQLVDYIDCRENKS